jgi:predicted DsbA family dithiol-disulfide isomerase
LTSLAVDIGLTAIEVGEMLHSDAYADAVRADEEQAQAMRITGVPFFVLNEKYGVSGAQPSELFAQALEKAWSEYEKENQVQELTTTDGASCDFDGNCK